MLRRLPRLSSRPTRQIATAVALAAYLMSTVGFPLPLPAAKDTSTPFPCQSHRCGCLSATQCWESCCCFSAAERLAWARQHGVTIPRTAREALAAAASDELGQSNRACCTAASDRTAEADCSADDDPACRTCHEADADGGLHFVFGFEAQQCQGLSLLWIASGVTLPAAAIDWEFDWLRVGDVCWPPYQLLAIVSPPPVPPPR